MDQKIQIYFFSGLSLLIAIVSFFIFQPFLSSVALAIFFALLLHPAYIKLLKHWKGHEKITALTIVVTTLVVVLVPLTLITTQLVTEIRGLYGDFQNGQTNSVEHSLLSVERSIQTIFPSFTLDTKQYVDSLVQWTQERVGTFVFGTIEGIFLFFLVLFLFYYFLYHGEKIKNECIRLSPLPDDYDRQILEAVKHTIDSVLRGTLLIAVIQGTLVGIGLWLFGVPNAVLLGCLAAFTALLPGIGTGVVTVPAVIFLFLTNSIPMAIGLGVWAAIVVGLVDNFLLPILYGKDLKVHPVFVLLSVLGGLNYFGVLGFIFGPIVLSLLIVLLRIYQRTIAPAQQKAKKASRKRIAA